MKYFVKCDLTLLEMKNLFCFLILVLELTVYYFFCKDMLINKFSSYLFLETIDWIKETVVSTFEKPLCSSGAATKQRLTTQRQTAVFVWPIGQSHWVASST